MSNTDVKKKEKVLSKEDEIRWQIVKAMLDEYSTLRKQVKEYLEHSE